MSKYKVPSLDRSKATMDGSLNSYQSVWMAHWKVAKPLPSHKSNFLSLNHETRESDSSSGQEFTSSPSHVPKMDRQFCKVPLKSTVNVKAVATNVANTVDGTAVAISQNLSNEEPVSAPSPILGLPLLDNATSTLRNERASGCSYDEVSNPLAMQSSSMNWIDGYVHGSEGLFASENFMGKKGIMVPTPFLGHHQVFLSQSNPLEATKQETFCSENPSGQSHPVIDVKTTTTCTFVDSNEGLTVGQRKFSQTTHQFFYREKTGTHLSKRGQIFRESTVDTNHEGNGTFGQFLSLSMNGNYHDNPCVKLQPLWSLTDSEGHESPDKGRTSAVASKNESSAETNTTDMYALPKKRLTGEASSFPKKEPSSGKCSGSMVKVDLCDRKRKFLALTTTSSSTENREPSPSKTQSFEAEHLLPHEDPGSHSNTGARFGDHAGPEQRQPRMKQPKASEPDHPLESLKTGDEYPVKKVKYLFGRISMQMKVTSRTVGADTLDEPLMGLGSGHSAQSVKDGEVTSRTVRADTLDEQLTGLGSGHSARSVKDGVSTSVDNTNAEKGRRALLLDPWIRRWCHGQAGALPKKKDPVVGYDLFGTKTFDESQKKQIPSVAAMALMGKAMNGFHPCEFKRRGSFIMWNS